MLAVSTLLGKWLFSFPFFVLLVLFRGLPLPFFFLMFSNLYRPDPLILRLMGIHMPALLRRCLDQRVAPTRRGDAVRPSSAVSLAK